MREQTRIVQGVRVPSLLYGTAWKEEATQPLVREALRSGFRGIDTANQRKHYHEVGVGRAIAEVLERGELRWGDLFIQTKFTYAAGQDHRLPYDPRAPVAEQVEQSFRSSLAHLGVERVDAYLLHGPSRRHGLGDADYAVWQAMERLQDGGHVKLIGVSNVNASQLRALLREARTPPAPPHPPSAGHARYRPAASGTSPGSRNRGTPDRPRGSGCGRRDAHRISWRHLPVCGNLAPCVGGGQQPRHAHTRDRVRPLLADPAPM